MAVDSREDANRLWAVDDIVSDLNRHGSPGGSHYHGLVTHHYNLLNTSRIGRTKTLAVQPTPTPGTRTSRPQAVRNRPDWRPSSQSGGLPLPLRRPFPGGGAQWPSAGPRLPPSHHGNPTDPGTSLCHRVHPTGPAISVAVSFKSALICGLNSSDPRDLSAD